MSLDRLRQAADLHDHPGASDTTKELLRAAWSALSPGEEEE